MALFVVPKGPYGRPERAVLHVMAHCTGKPLAINGLAFHTKILCNKRIVKIPTDD